MSLELPFPNEPKVRINELLGDRYDEERVSAILEGADAEEVERMVRELERRVHNARTVEVDRERKRWLQQWEERSRDRVA